MKDMYRILIAGLYFLLSPTVEIKVCAQDNVATLTLEQVVELEPLVLP